MWLRCIVAVGINLTLYMPWLPKLFVQRRGGLIVWVTDSIVLTLLVVQMRYSACHARLNLSKETLIARSPIYLNKVLLLEHVRSPHTGRKGEMQIRLDAARVGTDSGHLNIAQPASRAITCTTAIV
eukprot:6193074-Pleurochrysis_carterae.AAC.8